MSYKTQARKLFSYVVSWAKIGSRKPLIVTELLAYRARTNSFPPNVVLL